jgi:UDP-glucose 6-dehydrogenase
MYKANYMKEKTVVVWGAGYLSYTTMLKLQLHGFKIKLFDVDMDNLKPVINKKYPTKYQIEGWSKRGYLPELNLKGVEIIKNKNDVFSASDLHIVCIPENRQLKNSRRVAGEVAKIFLDKKDKTRNKPLIIFETAHVPGYIKKNFEDKLNDAGKKESKDYFSGVLFRTDWNIEDFISKDIKHVAAASSDEGLKHLMDVCGQLQIEPIKFNQIEEAEIFVNTQNALQALMSDCLRQIMLAYPGHDIRNISDEIYKNFNFNACALNLGTGGEKFTSSIDNLICGSKHAERLTIMKETQDTSLSSVLEYADFVLRKKYKEVGILGISYQGDQKDITLSPAITLADYLSGKDVKVKVYDSFLRSVEIKSLLGRSTILTKVEDVFNCEAVFVVSDNKEFKKLTQSKVDELSMKTKVIIDNYGIWESLKFPKCVKYHRIGDGCLDIFA